MNEKLVLAIAMISVLVSMLSVSSKAQITETAEIIYINADGSISPSTAPISTFDNASYTLTDNINGSIVIDRNSIVIDGNGHTLQGTGAYGSTGIDLSGRTNVTVQNTKIDNFYCGVCLNSSSFNSISDNNITGASKHGSISLNFSSYNNISGNNADNIILSDSSFNSISGTNMTNDGFDIVLVDSSFNSILGNNMTNNGWAVGAGGGVWLSSSSNNNSVSGNNVTANNRVAIEVDYSSFNSISGNNVTANNGNDIFLEGSSYITISENELTANFGYSIVLIVSSNSSVSENNVTANNGFGIWFSHSSDNKIYHNNFVENGQHAATDTESTNAWDDGYPSGGNYWSDYNGSDMYSGIYQNESGFDWIGDSPYVIDQNNTDRYPLMNPYSLETGEIELAYRSLLMKSDQLQTSLNANINDLQGQVDILNSTVNYLKTEVDNLTLTLNQTSSSFQGHIDSLGNTITGLQAQINSLNSTLQTSTSNTQNQYNSLNSKLDTISKITYLLATMTAVLIITAVYIAVRKPKQKRLQLP